MTKIEEYDIYNLSIHLKGDKKTHIPTSFHQLIWITNYLSETRYKKKWKI